MQKTGAGLHTANSCYWDTTMDGRQLSTSAELPQEVLFPTKKHTFTLTLLRAGSSTVRWENRTMYCVVSVFAVAV